jgi:hypothetical protein
LSGDLSGLRREMENKIAPMVKMTPPQKRKQRRPLKRLGINSSSKMNAP